MSYIDEQNKWKLDIMQSLARSQRAIAKILEGLAEINISGTNPEGIMEQLNAVSRHQQVLTVRLLGIQLQTKQKGKRGAPWLNPFCRI